ncbi:hypothetical protein AA18890_2519 [Komagataeibacter europaeus LMG 18890]|nr:hypothetical protein [Komagataeibacter europaeus]GBQ45981.1 hypothetical protein AA18890_2519 [Komagataeibacter europaeus LMG 18890]
MDFMADRLVDGRAFWFLNILDGFDHEGLAIEGAATSATGEFSVRALTDAAVVLVDTQASSRNPKGNIAIIRRCSPYFMFCFR